MRMSRSGRYLGESSMPKCCGSEGIQMTVCWVHDGEKTVTIGSNNERMPSRFGPPCNNSAPSVFFTSMEINGRERTMRYWPRTRPAGEGGTETIPLGDPDLVIAARRSLRLCPALRTLPRRPPAVLLYLPRRLG
jgi:hypothetical protein